MKKLLNLVVTVVLSLVLIISITSCDQPGSDNSEREDPKKDVISVSFNSMGGTAIESQLIKKGSKISEPLQPERNGYRFDGWYVGEEKWSFIGYVVTENLALYAKWTPVQYEIQYELDGGCFISNYATNYNIESEDIILTIPIKEGHFFAGWTCDNQTSPVRELMVQTGSYGNKIFTANWNKAQYSLEFVTNGGIAIESQVLEFSSQLPTPVRDGYTFGGWYTDARLMQSIATVPSDNSTVYASWLEETRTANFDFKIEKGNAIITDINSELSGQVVIPEYIGGFPVTTIGENSFSGGSNITSIVVPENTTSIGLEAFMGCSNLVDIHIGSLVSYIGLGAFWGCKNLENVYIKNIASWCNIDFGIGSVYGGLTHPMYYASNLYLNDELLTEVTIPEGVKTIGSGAFYNCNFINHIIISNTVTKIGDSAFYGCSGLKNISIPNSVTDIGYYVLSGCSNLTHLEIPFVGKTTNFLNDVYLYPFAYLFGDDEYVGSVPVQQYVRINPGSREKSQKETYYIPSSLKTVAISSGTIFKRAFYNVTTIKNIQFGEDVMCIEEWAFEGCLSLTNIYIYGDVFQVKSSAFKDCHSISKVYFGGTEEEWNNINIDVTNNDFFANAVLVYNYREQRGL